MARKFVSYKPFNRIKRTHVLAPSKVSKIFLHLIRIISPVYMKYVLQFSKVHIMKKDELIEHWSRFQNKKTRLILAFRHPYGDEPQLFAYVFNSLSYQKSRKSKKLLRNITHARFIHGYEVALWGDALIRWVLPRMGAVPVFHSKFDSSGMKTINSILADDEYPLALAPEGQVSYRSETVPRLESGTARMGFWCAQSLEKENRPEHVIILPLSVFHEYSRKDYKKLVHIAELLEQQCGIRHARPEKTVKTSNAAEMCAFEMDMIQRLITIESKLIQITEVYYQETYGYRPCPDTDFSTEKRQQRWDDLLFFAIETAEKSLGIPAPANESPSSGSIPAADNLSAAASDHPVAGLTSRSREQLISRLYKIRQTGWDRIYAKLPKDASELQKNLADRRAGEAWYAMRHMEFVDLVYYLNTDYLEGTDKNKPSYNRIVETAYNFYDIASRLSGGNFSNRLNIIRKKAIIYPCASIDVTERLPDYKKSWKSAVHNVMADLQESFEKNIKEYLNGKEQR